MKTEYTKGPWKFIHQNHNTKPSGQGQRYAVMAHVIDYLTRPEQRFVFNVKLDKTQDLDLHREAEANARLISAAPELLEALKLTLPMAKGYAHAHPVGSNQECIEIAEAAINKALNI